MGHEDSLDLVERATRALGAGDHVLALALADQVAAMDPEDSIARIVRVHALLAMGSVEEAFHEAQIAVLLDPESEDGQMALALAAWRRGRLTLAQQSFERARELSADNPSFVAQLAWFLANERSPKAAVRVAEQVLARTDRLATAWAALGLAQLRLRRFEEAETTLRRAMDTDPRSPEAQAAMVRLLKRRGDARQAEVLADVLGEAKSAWPDPRADEGEADASRSRFDLIRERRRGAWIKPALVVLAAFAAFAFVFFHEPVIAVFSLALGAAVVYARSLLRHIRAKM